MKPGRVSKMPIISRMYAPNILLIVIANILQKWAVFFSIDSHNILEDIELNGCCICSGENFEGVYSGLSVFLPQSNNINLNKITCFYSKMILSFLMISLLKKKVIQESN